MFESSITITRTVLAGLAWISVVSVLHAAKPVDPSQVQTRADLEALITRTASLELQQALRENAPSILIAAQQRPHLEAVIRAIDASPGKIVKVNITPEGLKRVAGGEITLLDTLSSVDLAIPNAGPHDKRAIDPYDSAFFEHLGHISSLESLNVIALLPKVEVKFP